MNTLIADPITIDWPARLATARIPFPVVGGMPINPVHPELPEGQGELGHWGERPCADAAVFVTVHGVRWLLMGRRDDGHGSATPAGGLGAGEAGMGGGETELEGGVRGWRREPGPGTDRNVRDVPVSVDGARYVPGPRAARNA